MNHDQPVIPPGTKISKGPFGLEFVEVDGVSWKRKLPETRW